MSGKIKKAEDSAKRASFAACPTGSGQKAFVGCLPRSKENKEIQKKRGLTSMKNLWKKAQKLLACTLALAFMLTMSAGAAEGVAATGNVLRDQNNNAYTEGTIDVGQRGSLTITKYSYNGETTEGDGLNTDTKPEGAERLPNVTFEYLKVASLVRNESTKKLEYQWCVDDTGVSSTTEFPTLSGLFGYQKGAAVTSDVLREKLDKIINGQLEGYVGETSGRTLESLNNKKGATPLTTTDTTSAVATATNLDLGIYLITEYSATKNVAVKADPFLAAIPMTNIGEVQIVGETGKRPAGTLWQYNVYVYPKNVVEVPDIEKNVRNKSEGDSEEKYTCVNIGDEVEFVIRATLPEHIDTMTKFTVTDTLCKGLSFVDGSVSFKTAQLNEKDRTKWNNFDANVEAKKTTDASTGETKLTWEFINGENHLTGQGNKELLIIYKAKLNKDCVIGREGNPNYVSLTYNHNNMIDEETGGDAVLTPDTPPRVYTFGLEINKVNGKDEPLQDVEFKLYKDSVSDANEVKVVFNAAKKSYYRIDANMIADDEEAATIKTDEQGKALIEGLEFGTYYLKETKTDPQYTLLEEPFQITLAPVLDVETGAYSANEKGAYFIQGKMADVQYYKLVAGRYVAIEDIAIYNSKTKQNLGSSEIYTYNEDTKKYEKAAMNFIRVKVGASEDDTESGDTVSVKIVNKLRFAVPGTGGMGTWMFTICGAVIIAAAAGLILIRRRRSMAK